MVSLDDELIIFQIIHPFVHSHQYCHFLLKKASGHPFLMRIAPSPIKHAAISNTNAYLKFGSVKIGVLHSVSYQTSCSTLSVAFEYQP
jgi:hypothetical protein